MSKMPFMQQVINVFDLKYHNILLLSVSVFTADNMHSVTPPQPFLALLLLCSSQCKEPALLFCRPSVQSHEGIYSQHFKYVYAIML